jgi:dipeptide/tripeptide permease
MRCLPLAAWAVVLSEFCERFAFYGSSSLLALYVVNLGFLDAGGATTLVHAFKAVVYLSPLGGSVLADSYLGKYRTVVAGSVLYQLALVALTLSSLFVLPLWLFCIGLFMLACSTGAIKGCVIG